eukprot:GCRY01000305.1.p1 GENE.GCRY01000305.1~~GCRY01000305.1.p1  ORF type:complete len:154 (-),score=39.95 GCRY01000305.1:144-605(-)
MLRAAAVALKRVAPVTPRVLLGSRYFGTKYYTISHEYIDVDGNNGVVGLTDFAQHQLGDIVFVDPPQAGDDVAQNLACGAVDSVKASSDLNSPISGTVTESNPILEENPSIVNEAPETEGWIFKVALGDTAELSNLMQDAEYAEFVKQEELNH